MSEEEYVGFKGVVEYLKGGVPGAGKSHAIKCVAGEYNKVVETDKNLSRAIDMLEKWAGKGGRFILLYEQLREEGLNQEEAMKVVKEEVEIQKLEAKGMTRSDAQGVVELNDPNHPSNKGRKNT
tara:strand:- start:1563 stop:1934 length:372 start_codon:yes stop_codon:yes gene_type:complete